MAEIFSAVFWVILLVVILTLGVLVMEKLAILDFLISNWEVLGLLLTNIGALFMKPPFTKDQKE